ncbi:cytochrome c oxidase subunit 3 [Sediminibacterium goheungense]|jgi:cytochrome c oxidase subunit III|uniref:Cytochrome c oxidase subunit 3 n=1 Tax=Sediminibacterium goheungense TaxID=1086393 RepID=A0A4R6IW18_9BACT|nr:heme-copper oxidase subunit III [Sediminibacterium goheungense]TDO26547.1 cytochrome c oxidase subunit 3 [Sediminibacterium goheungense]
MMTSVQTNEPKRIHPHKFTMWVAMGSIVMAFAGLTSAYIVKKNQSSWLEFDLPVVFWYSTAVILISSVTMHLATKAFKAREMGRYRTLMTVTAALGVLFIVLQYLGFVNLEANNIALVGAKSNSAASFLLVITGLHMVHVLGGVIALLVMFIRAYSSKTKTYSSVPVEVAGTYWHFVDVLWIYLFIFYNWIG